MGEHALDQLANFAAHGHQVLHPWRIADGARQMHQVHALQGKQVTLGHHAAQPLILDQTDVGDMSLGHGDGGVKGAVVRCQVERRVGHVLFNGVVKVTDTVGHHMT
ncbi:hypothetical protein D3C81_1775900 [compost metagenome]